MRIAIVGISVEIMLSSPIPTDLGSLQQYSGEDILNGDVWMIRGMLQRLSEDRDVEALPLYWATGLPGGAMTASAYAEVRSKVLNLIEQNGPFDAILIANHGALEVDGLGKDADTDFVVAVRDLVGPGIPIGVSLDLHGDMTPDFLDAATVFSVLRTAPHRDDKQTGYRVADQVLRVLRAGFTPKKAAVSIPILVPGETAITAQTPAKELYGSLMEYDSKPGIMEANILVGFAWNDRPWTRVNVLVVSEDSARLARAEASDLAMRVWTQRHEFRLRMETAAVEEGLARAARSEAGPVFVSDSGDNTTAGASGDLTLVLQAALDLPWMDDVVVAGITAPETVKRCTIGGVGSAVEIELGAEHLSRPRTARRVNAIVEAVGEELRPSGFQPYRNKEAAWVRVRIGKIIATFHAQPIGITTPQHFETMGIDSKGHKVYVVKLGYLHPQLEDIAARHILLLSDGTSQLDLTRLPWAEIRRPVYPLDHHIIWAPADGLYGDS